MQTERVTILTSSDEKAQLFQRAKRLGVSSSEVVRRALRNQDNDTDDAELAALVAEANAAIPKIAASIERMTKRLDEMNRKDEEFLKKMEIAK
jgi:hypothetical protein